MLIIQNDNTNPYFNLALEEYLLKDFKEDCFMLWQNEPCVVIGRNQNPLAEINQEFVKKNNIKVVKRLSGGGAVYHDLGNLNFSFIINDKQNDLRNYRKFTAPIIEVLSKFGVQAEITKRNDLTVKGLKFSGNAQYKNKNRLLHHGTILFSSNLNDVKSALTPESLIKGRYVKSFYSDVTNVNFYISNSILLEEFKKNIEMYINLLYNCEFYNLTKDDLNAINILVKNKYKSMKND